MNKTKIITMQTNKGGVGKTSALLNLAGVFALHKKKVLIIDVDGQGNAALAFGFVPKDLEFTLYDVLIEDVAVTDVIIEESEYIDLIPSNRNMFMFDFNVLTNLENHPQPFRLLQHKVIDQLPDGYYDYILIDTPPSLGLATGNALTCAHSVLIPFVPESFSVQGLIDVKISIEEVRESQNPDLQIEGVIATMVNTQTILHTDLVEGAREFCKENNIRMFDTVIPRSIVFANSVAYKERPATLTNPNDKFVQSYQRLYEEVIQNVETSKN